MKPTKMNWALRRGGFSVMDVEVTGSIVGRGATLLDKSFKKKSRVWVRFVTREGKKITDLKVFVAYLAEVIEFSVSDCCASLVVVHVVTAVNVPWNSHCRCWRARHVEWILERKIRQSLVVSDSIGSRDGNWCPRFDDGIYVAVSIYHIVHCAICLRLQ